jgi:hypothetical protein
MFPYVVHALFRQRGGRRNPFVANLYYLVPAAESANRKLPSNSLLRLVQSTTVQEGWMNLSILQSRDTDAVRTYVTKKFTKFASWRYSKKTRVQRCIKYYVAAAEWNRDLVVSIYQFTFKEPFPKQQAAALEASQNKEVAKLESGAWLDQQRDRLARSEGLLEQLKLWKKENEFEMGEGFFLRLQEAVADLDPTLCDPRQFRVESEASRVATLTGKASRLGKEASGEFNAMVGFKQKAGVSFEAYSATWGEINAKLEEEFKAGAWASGTASAKMTRLGFSAEIQAAIAIGAQFDVSGECVWKKNDLGLKLAGECHMFLGAKAEGSAKLSVSALKGIDASIKAGAFAGFSASASGTCAFIYGEKELASVTAEAGITFGVGANFEGSLKCPIFGPTKISLAANLTLGLGAEASVSTAINFTEIGLAASTQFRKLVYLPTIMKGYEMTLMTQDRRNLHYLDKCIARVEDDRAEMEDTIRTFEEIPMEKRPLLM